MQPDNAKYSQNPQPYGNYPQDGHGPIYPEYQNPHTLLPPAGYSAVPAHNPYNNNQNLVYNYPQYHELRGNNQNNQQNQAPFNIEPQREHLLNDSSSAELQAVKHLDGPARLGFIRKVYGILFTQLLITVFFVLISMNSKEFRKFQYYNSWLLYICLFVTIITLIALTCFFQVARQVPLNYFLLFTFTFSEAYLVSFICNYYSARVVLMAAMMTAGIAFALTVYACVTKTDFTTWGSSLFCFAMILMMMGFFSFFMNSRALEVIIAGCSVLLFSFYLIYDTQLIMGGGHKYSYEIDEYIVAALNLYVDIINIFLNLLSLLGGSNDD